MSFGAGCSKPGKRKRSGSNLDNIENECEPARAAEKYEHRRKRVRESPPTSPPLTPITPNNLSLQDLESPETSDHSKLRWSSCSISDTHSKLTSPVPIFNPNQLIRLMSQVDSRKDVSPEYFVKHPNLQPRMRSVLLDWLMEVCEAYKMHRATYYLSVNYLDRYLSSTRNIAKAQLQLIGITCLFIAAKVEEIYPPKVTEFSYVTNDACLVEDILKEELVILTKLEWNINALTVHAWFSLLLHMAHNKESHSKAGFLANHPVNDYLSTAQLVDVATMDVGCLRFPYMPLAAAAVYVMTDFSDVLHCLPVKISSEDKELMVECISWLKPFADAIKSIESSPRKLPTLDYKIQSHNGNLKLLDTIHERTKELRYSSVVMTPPNSSEKTTT